MPPPGFDLPVHPADEVSDFKGLRPMSSYGALYYILRTVFAAKKQRQLFHRKFFAILEVFFWARNAYRRIFGQKKSFSIIQQLLEHGNRKYYLVPLQVAADCTMRSAALGWDSTRLISNTLESFAKHAPPDCRIVFKVHPLERGHSNHAHLINATAKAFDIQERVDVIDTGSLGPLAKHSAGMITINSTAGLSAIFHGIPLLVIGKAVYANPRLAICGEGNPNLDAFWTTKQVASEADRKKYLAWLKQKALKPGDFYASEGIKVACKGVLAKLAEENTLCRPEDHLRAEF